MSENKYQEALNRIVDDDYNFPHDHYEEDKAVAKERDIEILQELVDKATPQKPKGISVSFDGRVANCPCCNTFIREQDQKPNICKCGQVFDWSEEDE